MPIERELKFVLRNTPELETCARTNAESIVSITQFYLADNARFRQKSLLNANDEIIDKEYFFTFKQMINGKLLEIETEISQSDFNLAFQANPYKQNITKKRHLYCDETFTYEIDIFYHGIHYKSSYFAMMEIEAIDDKFPDIIPEWIEPFIALKVPEEHNGYFTNKKLLDLTYASKILETYRLAHI